MDQDKVDTFVSAYGQDAKKQNIVSVLFDLIGSQKSVVVF